MTKSNIITNPVHSVESISKPRTLQLVLAFTAIYVIWSTTYAAMSVAVETIPPFLVAGTRFLISGFVAFGFLSVFKKQRPTLAQWRSAAIVGSLMMVGGNGLVMFALKKTPSGTAALIVATSPLWITLLDWLFYRAAKPNLQTVAGLVIGMIGLVFLVLGQPANPDEHHKGFHLPSIILLMLAPISWAVGSLLSRRIDLPKDIFMATSMETLCGGAMLILMSLLAGDWVSFEMSQVSTRSVFATWYLAIFGSLIGLTAYGWLLKNVSAAKVSTHTFVNLVAAVFIGWWLLDEIITRETCISVALIIVAVALIVIRKPQLPVRRKLKAQPEPS